MPANYYGGGTFYDKQNDRSDTMTEITGTTENLEAGLKQIEQSAPQISK